MQYAIAVITSEMDPSNNKSVTYKVMTKPKKKPNNCAAIAGFGDMAATHNANVVRYIGNMMPSIRYEYPARLEGKPTSQYHNRK